MRRRPNALHRPASRWENLVTAVSIAVVTIAVVLLVALAWGRIAMTNRELANRVSLIAVPTDDFETTEEEILRYAHQLSRTRRAAGRASRGTQAVCIRLESGPAGQLRYRLEGPARSRSILQLGGYARVELRQPESVDAAEAPSTSDEPVGKEHAQPSDEQVAGADGGGHISPSETDSPEAEQ